jgi:hypothetical protein
MVVLGHSGGTMTQHVPHVGGTKRYQLRGGNGNGGTHGDETLPVEGATEMVE